MIIRGFFRAAEIGKPGRSGVEVRMEIALGIILIVASVFLIVAVLMQNGKSHNLSGVIAGGAETFFGKSKGDTLDKKLSKLTTVVAIVFVLIVVVVYLMQDTSSNTTYVAPNDTSAVTDTVDTTDAAETTAEETTAAETTAAETTAANG